MKQLRRKHSTRLTADLRIMNDVEATISDALALEAKG